MSHEAPNAKSTEQISPAPETVGSAFVAAHHNLYKLTADPNLHAELVTRRINPYDDAGKPVYWSAVADHAQKRITALREKHGDSLRLSAFELAAATPNFLLANHNLDTNPTMSGAEARKSLETVSGFNDMLRSFATRYPDTKAIDVTRGLLSVVNSTIEDRNVRQASSQMIQRHVRGAQHELAFGQLLAKSGRAYHAATMTEDLRGADYIVQGAYGANISINVKASETDLRDKSGYNGYYSYDRGNLYMQSLSRDSDFQGTFFIPDELAAERAPMLSALLTRAESERSIPAYA